LGVFAAEGRHPRFQCADRIEEVLKDWLFVFRFALLHDRTVDAVVVEGIPCLTVPIREHRFQSRVRNVTQRELDMIVRLGYLLGGLVGMVAFGVSVLVGR
jgi:uncharacterized membrane protein YheB (UPF0754 family)